jgi:ketosteroid isomerase-like protein
MMRAAPPLKVAGLACAALVACHTGIGGHLSEGDRDTIRTMTRESTRFRLSPAADVDAYVKARYAEDARVLPPNHETITGREAIAALLRSAGPVQQYQATIRDIEGRNDLAYADGTYERSATPPGPGEPVSDRGKYVEIWKKQRDGGWKVVLEIFNSDLPAPPVRVAATPAPAPPD